MNGLLLKVVRGQRRSIALAGIISGIAVWGLGVFGHLTIGLFFAAGVFLELVNKLLTEYGLMRSTEVGELPSRKQVGFSALGRLMGVTVVAVGLAALFWPNGIGVLFGLAIFHLILLVLTGIPLLRELRKA